LEKNGRSQRIVAESIVGGQGREKADFWGTKGGGNRQEDHL